MSGPFVGRCLTSSAMLRVHIPLIELDVRISRIQLSDEESWVWHAMPSEASGPFPEFLGLHQSPRLRFLRHSPRTKAPSLHRHYAASRVLRASPPPQTARPASRELPVDPYGDLRWGFPCCDRSPCACMPSPLPRQEVEGIFARLPPAPSAFPVMQPGRLLHYPFRGLLSVYSRYGLPARWVTQSDLVPPEASAVSLLPRLLRLLPAEATVAGWEFHPLKIAAFSRRTARAG
jgi:hypothetical protein